MPSRREIVRMDTEEISTLLNSQVMGVLGTIGPNGDPHLVNIAYVFEGGRIVMSSFRAAQKVKNLERTMRATFLVEVNWPYDQIRGVMISGPVEIDYTPERAAEIEAKVRQRNADLHDGEGALDMEPGRYATKRCVMSIDLERVRSWDHGKLAGGY